MLKNRYEEILLGTGLMTLLRGLISLEKNRSTLLIDDDRFNGENHHQYFLSELEILAFLRLGTRHHIPEIKGLRRFLMPAEVNLVSSETRIRLGRSPFENIKEVIRKYPELIPATDVDLLYAENPEDFNTMAMNELTRYESLCFEYSQKLKPLRFELQGPKWFKSFYQKFGEEMNREYTTSKCLKYASLLHLLGLSAEEKLKTRLSREEIPFYFFRLLSPIYRLQDFFLATQLKRRLLLRGGDYKQSRVQFWQFYNSRFENLLLESFEGVISGSRVLFFSHLPEQVPFSIKSPYSFIRKNKVSPENKGKRAAFPPTKITYASHLNLLGSDHPYRVLLEGDEGFSAYLWPYPQLPGSKSDFYNSQTNLSFSEDASALPFDYPSVEVSGVEGVNLDLRSSQALSKSPGSIFKRVPMDIVEGDKVIQGFEYWGPFRYYSLGMLSICYGIEWN